MAAEAHDWMDTWGAVFLPHTLSIDTWRIAIRQITNATNSRTIIAAIIPPGVAVGGNAFVVRLSPLSLAATRQPLFDGFRSAAAVAPEESATQLELGLV